MAGQEEQRIDMSLDDIIKLQKDETETEPTANQTDQQRKARNAMFQGKRFYRGVPMNQQGPNRRKLVFRQQGHSGVYIRNNGEPVTRRRAAAINGLSPLNRQNPRTQGPPKTSTVVTYTNGNQPGNQRRPYQQRRFRPATSFMSDLTQSTVNIQNRRPEFNRRPRQQRAFTINQKRRLTQQNKPNIGRRQLNAEGWTSEEGFGSTLTVSVNNPKANYNKPLGKPGIRRPGLRFRNPASQQTDPPPKGVPLKFNFPAMANHTRVTLNERFSTLKIRGRFTRRRGGRTVMLA